MAFIPDIQMGTDKYMGPEYGVGEKGALIQLLKNA